jgi:hypothetical protein
MMKNDFIFEEKEEIEKAHFDENVDTLIEDPADKFICDSCA